MSDLDRITEIMHLRVRAMPQVKLATVLNVTGLNILRAMALKNLLRRQEKGKKGSNPSPNGLIEDVKEQILQLLGYLKDLFWAVRLVHQRIACYACHA
jgi:hypothetical protein